MTSEQIADLVGSRHDDVKRSIERLADRGVISFPPLAEKRHSEGRPGKEYVFEGEKGKRDSIIAVAQLSPEFTAVLVDRWQMLESAVAQPAFAVPTSFADALRLAGELEEQRMALTHQVGIQAAKIAEDAPKAKFHDDVSESEGLKGVSEVAKILGTGEKRLFNYLRKHKILIGEGDTRNMPYQPHLDNGRMDVKWNNYTVPDTGEVKIHPRPLFTGKGVIWIRQYIEKYGREGL